ncbi:MAG: biotin--[acetyl-CoA-carboxylase] ligase [Lachnospiraceae bacterium]|nr:biotin--[acetyl-CoA-carboxylase] ligase [Lachnospiraceae bacterium]
MKTKILSMLSDKDAYVSGQALCEKLQVSRTAIWKIMNQLRGDGYEIESVPSKGYRITKRPDRITSEEIISRLHSCWAAQQVYYYEAIDSTNNEAKRLAEKGAVSGTLVVAEEQLQGKGRRGRSWVTPARTAIAMSLILRPGLFENVRLQPEHAPMLTLVMGMAVAAACRDVCGVEVGIKWPNDVVAGGKKICGILTEMSCEMDYINYVVIGIGINTGVEQFPPELSQTAVSLHTLMGCRPDRAKLIDVCMEKFEQYYDRFMETQDFTHLLEEYNALLLGKGDRVRVLSPGWEFEGISCGINTRGELMVRRRDGTVESVFAGEVSVRGIYGYV